MSNLHLHHEQPTADWSVSTVAAGWTQQPGQQCDQPAMQVMAALVRRLVSVSDPEKRSSRMSLKDDRLKTDYKSKVPVHTDDDNGL